MARVRGSPHQTSHQGLWVPMCWGWKNLQEKYFATRGCSTKIQRNSLIAFTGKHSVIESYHEPVSKLSLLFSQPILHKLSSTEKHCTFSSRLYTRRRFPREPREINIALDRSSVLAATWYLRTGGAGFLHGTEICVWSVCFPLFLSTPMMNKLEQYEDMWGCHI